MGEKLLEWSLDTGWHLIRTHKWYGASLVAQLAKKSAYNRGDLGSIPGLRTSPEEGKGYHSSILA